MAYIECDRRLSAVLAANAAQRLPFSSRCSLACLLAACLLLAGTAVSAPTAGRDPKELKNLTLEELGDVKVTTASKQPEEVWNTSAAIFVITQEDIRRSGVTNIPDALRL